MGALGLRLISFLIAIECLTWEDRDPNERNGFIALKESHALSSAWRYLVREE